MSWWSRRILPFLIEKSCRSRQILAERTRWVPRAHGEVLELGVGSGLNLAFYDPARVVKVTGIDPSGPLLARAAARAAALAVPISLVRAPAEELPFEARAFDSAVVTYSLCSVADPLRALAELRRVVRPGGALWFVEHGLSPDPGPARWQRRLTPLWRRVSGNCHLDRDIAGLLRTAGFALDELEAGYGEGPRWLGYRFRGAARCP